MTSTDPSKMNNSKISPETIYGWKSYTEREVSIELRYLYSTQKFMEGGINLGINQLQNVRHKFGQKNIEKYNEISEYLQRCYNELDQIEREIAYFENIQSYYDDIRMRDEDTYPYDY
jgi:hypothetical protein